MDDLEETEAMDMLLVKQGFSFDFFFNVGSRTYEYVELNGFGVRSNCGSCLFQWMKDRDLLYGWSNLVAFWVIS